MTRFGKTIHDFANFNTEIAKSNVTGHTCVYKFGHDPDVDAADGYQDLVVGGTYAGFTAVAAQTLDVISDNDEDNGAGTDTGALTIVVEGLDVNYLEVSETIILNGLTNVTPSANSYIRVNRAYVATAGSTGSNVGTITIDQTASNIDMAVIEPTYGQTMQACYTVPANKTAYLTQWATSSNAAIGASLTHVDARVNTREFGTGAWRVREQYAMLSHGTTSQTHEYVIPIALVSAKADIKLTGQTTTNNTTIEGQFGILLIDD